MISLDAKRLKLLSQLGSSITIGDQGIDPQLFNELHLFLDVLFGKKRLLILKVNINKNNIIKELMDYCNMKKLEFCKLDDMNLKVDDVKGELEIVYENGEPYSNRNKPNYISGSNQMIFVDNLGKETDIEILRAFMYMGSLGSYYDDIKNLPKEKLPYGSAYVFIAENNFPLKKFASISSYWLNEAAVLDMRDFQTKVKEHLGEYKRNMLNISENGIFNYRNKEFLYEYILQIDKYKLNIIEKYRNDFFATKAKKIIFHKYFHHLNSSQAMCINFFYPLINKNLLELILNIMGIESEIKYNSDEICFEKESELETNTGRRTNFDFYINLKSRIKIYFEIKYTEIGFGKAKHDHEHINKFNNLYMPLLNNNPAIKKIYKSEDIFLNNYQIMRNLIHIDKDSYVIFIYPKENLSIRKTALSAREEIIENGWKNHLILFTWEDLIQQLKYSLNSKDLIDYYEEFSYKYLEY